MKTKFTLLGGAALLAFASMGVASPVEAKETWGKGAPEFSDPDGNIKFKVRGRIQMDAVNLDQTSDDGSNDEETFSTRMRRARLGVEGQFDSKFKYKAEATFLSNDRTGGANEVEWEDVYLEYAASFGSLVVGQQKIGSPLEEATSSRFTAAMERNMMTGAFGFGRALGVGVILGGETNWQLAGFFNTDNLNDADLPRDGETDETKTVLLHGHYAPWSEKQKVLHLGGTLRFRDSGAGGASAADAFQYRARSATNIGDRLASTDDIYKSDTFYGVEAATIMGPFWASAEYGLLSAEGVASADDADFQSYNLQAGWFLTGESRGYKAKSGEFDRTTPLAPVSEGGMGSWELRARYDFLDLNDGTAGGGEATAYTVGVNWAPVKNVRFQGEYSNTDVKERALGDNGEADVIQFRAQFDF